MFGVMCRQLPRPQKTELPFLKPGHNTILMPNGAPDWGRQVLSYDNQRIMGEIDWAQQGQSHDAALITFKPNNHQLDLGFAVNSDSEKLYRDLYTTSYKHMQYAWYHTSFSNLNMSLLFLNVGFQYKDIPTNELEVDNMQTFGTYLSYKKNKFEGNLGVYGQTGEGKLVTENTSISSLYGGLNVSYAFTDKFKAGLGYEYLSGKDQDDTDSTIKSFNPIFGTNHGFNGFMDYFYVGITKIRWACRTFSQNSLMPPANGNSIRCHTFSCTRC